jgi:cytochrome c
MNSFEMNKILGALLGTCLAILSVHIASGALFTPAAPAKAGYEIAAKEESSKPSGEAKADVPIATLLPTASVQQGQQISKQCQICHNLGKGEGTKTGPDLYGVVGRVRASVTGFNYSDGMKSKPGTWTFDELNNFLTNPRGYIPGTQMLFAGLKDEKQRADLIAYLNSNSDAPLPLPAAQNAPANPPAAQNAAAPANPPAAAPAKPAAPAKAPDTK